MNKEFKYIIIITLTGLLVAIGTTHTKYMKWQQVSMSENSRQDAVIPNTFIYEESDNPLFYTSKELTEYMVDDMQSINDKEELDDTLLLIKEICPYVEVDMNGVHVPKTDRNSTEEKSMLKSKTSPTVKRYETDAYKLLISELMTEAESCLGTPYVWGGTTIHKGMDCSGFTQYIYKRIGFTLPRVSYEQCKVGKLVKRDELRPGDLLFFDTTNYRDKTDIKTPESEFEYAQQMASGYVPNVISHVGLYVGNGMMIHAASGYGKVMYQSLDEDYYKVRFINARRLIRDE